MRINGRNSDEYLGEVAYMSQFVVRQKTFELRYFIVLSKSDVTDI